jgi:hypothetical protein
MSLPTQLMWNIFTKITDKIGESQNLENIILLE